MLSYYVISYRMLIVLVCHATMSSHYTVYIIVPLQAACLQHNITHCHMNMSRHVIPYYSLWPYHIMSWSDKGEPSYNIKLSYCFGLSADLIWRRTCENSSHHQQPYTITSI